MLTIVRNNNELELVAETPGQAKILTLMGEHGVHVQAVDRVSKKARIILVPRLVKEGPKRRRIGKIDSVSSVHFASGY